MDEKDPKPLTQSEADEVREGPGKVPGEGSGSTEAAPTGTRGEDDVASAAVGDGPSGGADSADTNTTSTDGGEATGDTPTQGGGTGVGEGGGG